jgi:hypothetical protein
VQQVVEIQYSHQLPLTVEDMVLSRA